MAMNTATPVTEQNGLMQRLWGNFLTSLFLLVEGSLEKQIEKAWNRAQAVDDMFGQRTYQEIKGSALEVPPQVFFAILDQVANVNGGSIRILKIDIPVKRGETIMLFQALAWSRDNPGCWKIFEAYIPDTNGLAHRIRTAMKDGQRIS